MNTNRMDETALMQWLRDAEGPLLRHEVRDDYDVPSDGDDFQRYLNGEAHPSPSVGAGWREFVRTHGDVRRVRVLHGEPSDFVRFECEWQYQPNIDAGESIRILDAKDRLAATEAELWATNHAAVVMRYLRDGTFSHAELSADSHLVKAAWRDYQNAYPFKAWWSANPQYHREHWLPEAALSG